MALGKFGFVFSDQFVIDNITSPSEVDWAPPADNTFITPACPKQADYKPGNTSLLYHDYTELWLGYPTWTAKWDYLLPADIEAIRQAYTAALTSGTSYGRCWVYWLNGETGQWQADGAIMDEPEQDGYTGELARGFNLTFGRLGLQINRHNGPSAFDRIEAGETLEYGSSDFANNSYRY